MAPTSTSRNQQIPYFQLPMSPALPSRSVSPTRDSPFPSAPKHAFPTPLYRIHLDNVAHKGTADFLSAVDAATALEDAVANVLRLLYDIKRPSPAAGAGTVEPVTAPAAAAVAATSSIPPLASLLPPPPASDDNRIAAPPAPSAPVPDARPHPTHPAPPPPVRSITLTLREMDGVAYTTGSLLDGEHKEIHVSAGYVGTRGGGAAAVRHEVRGVLTHEMVHVWQYDGRGTCPGGLIEGVADWVRLRAGLGAAHWREVRAPETGRGGEGDWGWDAGYEKTGFFLDWLENRKCGDGTVARLNAWLRGREYVGSGEEGIWKEVCGEEVDVLWREYQAWLKETEMGRDEGSSRERMRSDCENEQEM